MILAPGPFASNWDNLTIWSANALVLLLRSSVGKVPTQHQIPIAEYD